MCFLWVGSLQSLFLNIMMTLFCTVACLFVAEFNFSSLFFFLYWSMDPTEIARDRVTVKEGDSFGTRIKKYLLSGFYFFQLNGGYFALYGMMLPGVLINILSAVFNEYVLSYE